MKEIVYLQMVKYLYIIYILMSMNMVIATITTLKGLKSFYYTKVK